LPRNSYPYSGWTGDLNDLAAAKDLVKFDRETALEGFLCGGGALGILAALQMLLIGTIGSRRSASHPAVLPYVLVAVLVSVLFFVARYFTDNYYLVDPKQHLVYYHFKFLWFRRVHLLLRREDILAVSTRGRRQSSRSETWWEYQVVVIGANGHVVPFCDWERDALSECNAEVERLGSMLGCQSHKSPPECELRFEVSNGSVSVDFKQLPWWAVRLPVGFWVVILGVLLAVGVGVLHFLRT